MDTNFDRGFEFAMKWEKHRSENPKDPGGLTIWGISTKYYPEIVSQIKDLPQGESLEFARKFYREKYWDRMDCNRIAVPLDIVVFDTAIVPGPGAARTMLSLTHNWRDFIFLRIQYFKNSPAAGLFLRGWINRCLALWELARGF